MKITLGNPAQQGRQLVLLAVLTMTAAALLWNQFGGATAEVTGGTSNIPAAAARGADSTAALPEGLRLAALEPAVEAPLGARDPFGFGEPPRPAARLAPPAPPVAAAPPEAPDTDLHPFLCPGYPADR